MRKPNPSEVTNALINALLPKSPTCQPKDQIKYHDVVIQTSDNHKIPAIRAILALRSPFFSRLFYAPFSESKSSTVAVDIPQRSLIQVLHFIYSDESPTLRRLDDAIRRSHGGSKARRKAWGALRCRDIETAVGVVAAADYCQINVLAEWGCSVIMKAIRVKQGLACIALQAIVERGGVCRKLAEAQEELLRYVVRYTPGCFAAPFGDEERPLAVRECFGYAGKCGLMHLGDDVIKLVFGRLKEKNSEWLSMAVLFDALHFWATGGKRLPSPEEEREDKVNLQNDRERKTKDVSPGKSAQKAKDGGQKEKTAVLSTAMNGVKDANGERNAGETSVQRGETSRESSRWKAAMACAGMMEAPTSTFLVTALEPSGLLSEEVLFRFYRDVTIRTAIAENAEQSVASGVEPGSDEEDDGIE